MHFDWGASYFLTEHFHIGREGYVYKEIGWNSGSGDHLAPHLNTSQFGCRPALAGGLCYLPSGVRTPIQASRTC
jgi:hypothetical protein